MVAMDIRKKYTGNLLGISWAILSPAFSISLIFFVFKYGLKTSHLEGVSFLYWLIAGMLSWLYFSDALSNGIHAFVENSYLITKVQFPIEILPVVRVTSPILIHLLLLFFFLLGLLISKEVSISIYWFQLIYYIFCSYALSLSITFTVATFFVFVRDVQNFLQVFLQLLYWVTPIFWSPTLLPEKFQSLILFNPLYYIIQGYRDSIFHQVPIWEKKSGMLYFWIVTILIYLFGKIIFKKLKPQFADVL